MDAAFTPLWIAHLFAAVVSGWFVLWVYSWIRRQSRIAGLIVAAAILGRAFVGLALFWISYLELPFARSLQVGGGFWQIALDATGYFQIASIIAESGRLVPLDHTLPSPFFLNALGIWMGAVGVSPAAGMFLNLFLYTAVVGLLVFSFRPVDDWRQDLPCLVGISAYSFSPVLVMHSTQPLKDDLAGFLMTAACVGVLAARRLISGHRGWRDVMVTAAAFLVVGLATSGMAGIRWYNAVIILGGLALVLALFLVAIRWRNTPLLPYLGGSFTLLAIAWWGFSAGAGPLYQFVGANVERILRPQVFPQELSWSEFSRIGSGAARRLVAIPADLMDLTQISRTGFLLSGGSTNVVVPLRDASKPGQSQAAALTDEQRETAAYEDMEKLPPAAPPEFITSALSRARATPPPAAAPPATPPPGVPPPAPDNTLLELAYRAVPITILDQARAIITGLAVVFVPLSFMKALGVQVSGGRGFLTLVDIDTLFIDATIALVIWLLWTRRRLIGDRLPFVIFGLIVFSTTVVLLGYVVTNYGTLWRLRSLAAVPLWVLVAALPPQRVAAQEKADAPQPELATS